MSVLTSDDLKAVRRIIDSIGAPVTVGETEPDGRIRTFAVNRAAAAFYGVPTEYIEGKTLDELGLKPEGRAELIRRRYVKCIEEGASLTFKDFAPVDTAHGRRWVHTTMSPLVDEDHRVTRVMATLFDVTDLKLVEEALVDRLATALSGFIPICAACKKIRDSDESWHPVEEYIGTRSEARFSHSMCPSCAEEWYGPQDDG